MGENRWRDEAEWPLARAVPTNFHLRGGRALGREAPAPDEAPDTFTADPNDPVPTLGGNLCCWQLVHSPGAFDQRQSRHGTDVLVYSTEPLCGGRRGHGTARGAHLRRLDGPRFRRHGEARGCRTRTGIARNVAEGIRRARYRSRHGGRVAAPCRRGGRRSTSTCLRQRMCSLAGHRIRVEIAASNWPRFDRNPQTGGVIAEARELRPARQTVFHDAARPSRIVLPVVPRSDVSSRRRDRAGTVDRAATVAGLQAKRRFRVARVAWTGRLRPDKIDEYVARMRTSGRRCSR